MRRSREAGMAMVAVLVVVIVVVAVVVAAVTYAYAHRDDGNANSPDDPPEGQSGDPVARGRMLLGASVMNRHLDDDFRLEIYQSDFYAEEYESQGLNLGMLFQQSIGTDYNQRVEFTLTVTGPGNFDIEDTVTKTVDLPEGETTGVTTKSNWFHFWEGGAYTWSLTAKVRGHSAQDSAHGTFTLQETSSGAWRAS